MAKIVKKKFKVDGLDCASCCMLIDGALEDLDGVESASTNYASCECEVEFDEEKIAVKKIIRAITEVGHEAEDITSN